MLVPSSSRSDGTAFSIFLDTWAAIARGTGEAVSPPCLDRTLLRARAQPTVRFDHVEYSSSGGGGGPTTSEKKVPFQTCTLPMSMNQVSRLEHEAIAGKPDNKKVMITTFNAVVAHVWQCACLALRS